MFIHQSIDVKFEDLYVKYFRVLVFAREQDIARRGLRCWRRLWPAPDSAEAQQNLAHFLSQNLDHCHWAGGSLGLASCWEGAHNAKFTHQHNTVPSITSILSPQYPLLLITDMIKVTEISDNLKHDHRRSS